MLKYKIPGYKTIEIEHLVLDFNGTLAVDGRLVDGVRGCLEVLSRGMAIHVITADTFGKVASEMENIPCKVSILPLENQDTAKLDYVKQLGADQTACIGNGRNDRLMLEASALGIAVILEEGVASQTLFAADVVSKNIVSALELLMNPLRLTATLRS